MRLTRRRLLSGAGATLLFPGAGAARVPLTIIDGPAFGAAWRAALPAGPDAGAVGTALRAVVASVDGAMSPFRADSEISRFNASDETGWIAVAAETRAVVTEGLRVARLSGGAFDPTVGALVGRYGFGPIIRPSAGDHRDIAVGTAGIRKAQPSMTLDLCGIAKGHALDRMVAALDGMGLSDFLIELGGEVCGRGRHPSGRGWQVGIERPLPGELVFQRVVGLGGQALATSGDRINSYEVAGRRYGHIIDPAQGRPAAGALASVSVLAPAAITADALATALFAMGAEAGAAFAEGEAIAALFLLRDGGGIREITTGDFDTHILA
jgi:thiamine biosynthesis lipoprotein